MLTSNLIQVLQTTLIGCEAQSMPDIEVCKVIHAIIDDDKKELATPDAADLLNKSEATLKRWRAKKCGPRYRKDAGGAIRYRLDWLREFQERGLVSG